MTVKAAILLLTMLGNGQPVAHMRNAPEGADARAGYFARMVEDAAAIHQVDALLVVAVIFTESGFDPERQGALGERGLMQLHPRSPWFKAAMQACDGTPELCDWAMVFEGVKLLSWAVNKCKTYRLAIGAYRTRGGRCIPVQGADRVMRVYQRIGGES